MNAEIFHRQRKTWLRELQSYNVLKQFTRKSDFTIPLNASRLSINCISQMPFERDLRTIRSQSRHVSNGGGGKKRTRAREQGWQPSMHGRPMTSFAKSNGGRRWQRQEDSPRPTPPRPIELLDHALDSTPSTDIRSLTTCSFICEQSASRFALR